MNPEWQKEYEFHKPTAAASLPPAMVEETGWDILLALYSGERSGINLDRLGALISAPPQAMNRWLSSLEDQQLVVGVKHEFTGELRAMLTPSGRDMLDNYLSATNSLQARTHH